MSHFCFYQGDNPAVAEALRSQAISLWGDIKELSVDSFWLFIQAIDYDQTFAQTRFTVGAITGYVRSETIKEPRNGKTPVAVPHNSRFIDEIAGEGNWPLSREWTGSFGAVAYHRLGGEVVICNDSIGYRPVYYSVDAYGLIGGTSLIALGRTMSFTVDVVGVLERITAPYCNYGSRTLLKDVSRLMPGERIQFSRYGQRACSTFDNELCNEIVDSDVNKVARLVWDTLQHETDLALNPTDAVNVALSGGWDSRLALATVSERSSALKCYTFGNGSLHEVQTAKRCALAVGASHQFFPIEDRYFPTRTSLEELVEETETVNHLQWYTMTDSLKGLPFREVILLGDLCESIVALNMKQFSTRNARVSSFTKGLFGQAEQIDPATEENFTSWKEETRSRLIGLILRNMSRLAPELAENCQSKRVTEEVVEDLEKCFHRVAEIRPPFAPLYDELFGWFHRARFLIAGQALLLNTTFRPLCPAVSLRFMRLISTVHPRMRIRRRLMNAIAKLPEFDKLARIPSAQIPWLHARTPALAREVIWGARSGIDQVLTRRALKNKNPDMRRRVMPTLDYLREYKHADALPNVQSWFSGKWLNGETYADIVRRRAQLAAWPLMNLDIAAPANVSITLDLCGLQRDHENIPVDQLELVGNA